MGKKPACQQRPSSSSELDILEVRLDLKLIRLNQVRVRNHIELKTNLFLN